MQSKRIESLDELAALKARYMQEVTAPLDGMWHLGFVPMATHFGLYDGDELAGYYCVNDDGYLLEFYVLPKHRDQSSAVLQALLGPAGATTIKGAFASTAEPGFFVPCLDTFSSFEAHTLMYQLAATSAVDGQGSGDLPLPLEQLHAGQLSEVVEFANAAMGAPREWLGGYYTRTIERGEVFGLWGEARLVAVGENRGFDQFQNEYSELGVIVAEAERGQGLAVRVLQHLVAQNQERGLKSICSTEMTNIGAQRAISRAGFFAPHRIVKFTAPKE